MGLSIKTARWLVERAYKTNTFEQDAKPTGIARCSGCWMLAPIVYTNYLQWCEECWPALVAGALVPDTQSKDFATRRSSQIRDYGWVSARPSEEGGE